MKKYAIIYTENGVQKRFETTAVDASDAIKKFVEAGHDQQTIDDMEYIGR